MHNKNKLGDLLLFIMQKKFVYSDILERENIDKDINNETTIIFLTKRKISVFEIRNCCCKIISTLKSYVFREIKYTKIQIFKDYIFYDFIKTLTTSHPKIISWNHLKEIKTLK